MSPALLSAHLSGERGQIADDAAAAKPHVDRDIAGSRLRLVPAYLPAHVVIMVSQAGPLGVVDQTHAAGVLIEIVDDERVACGSRLVPEPEAERVTGRVEKDAYVPLGLKIGQGCARLDGMCARA